MSRATRAGSYRAVLLLPYAPRTFAPALAGRLAYGVFPLATLFTVQQATGSYATAGLALAAFGLASITLPAKARLADRFGQRATLPPLAALCATALTAATFVTDPAGLVALIAVAGLAAPPLGSAMRSNWRRLTEESGLKERAYAVDSVAEESLYLVGPLVAGLLVGLRPAGDALLCTAALLLAGTAGMASAPPARHREPAAGGRMFDLGPLGSPGLRRVLAVMLVSAAGFSVAFPGLVAAAQAAGRPAAAGLLEAALAVGSVLGGLLWARRAHRRGRSEHLALLTGLVAAGLAGAAAVATGLVALGVALALAGLAIGPLYVVAYLAADDFAPPGRHTEASTWINVAANAGGAAGTAVAGALVDTSGPGPAFLAGAALLAVTAVAIRAAGPVLDRN